MHAEFGRKYPNAGYGKQFREWIYATNPLPYNSWANGSAMRVSACGHVASSLEEAIELSKRVSSVTHNHPEGIKGAEATAVAIFMARTGCNLLEIQDYIHKHYYEINFKLDDIRDSYRFDVSCQGSVPQAMEAFFESTSFEDAIRNAISIGGLSMIFAPYEMFGPTAEYIMENTPYEMTMIVTCANGAMGYLPTEKAYDYQVYEGLVTKFVPGTAEALADEFLNMLTELKG